MGVMRAWVKWRKQNFVIIKFGWQNSRLCKKLESEMSHLQQFLFCSADEVENKKIESGVER